MNQHLLRQRLSELAEPSYRAFSKKLKVSDRLIFGIRTPKLQKLIKQLYEEEGIKALDDFFIYQEPSYEEIQIAFSLFGLLKLDYQSALLYLDRLRPFNDSWATNDNLAGWFSHLAQEKDFYRYLRSLLREQNPYDQRLGIVSLMNYYLVESSIEETLVELASVTNPHYYVVMALGWAYATAFCKDRNKTLPYLQPGILGEQVRRKAIQKCLESRLVSEEDKTLLKSLRKTP